MKMRNIIIFFFLVFEITKVFSQSRIVSLAPSLTKMIYLLEANDKLVGCTSYCEIASNDKVDVVASAKEVNIEKLYILKPDLVVATTITKQATLETLKKLGIKVMLLPTPKSYNDICSQFIEIGKYLGNPAFAKNIIDQQNKRLANLRLSVTPNKKPKVFFEIGAKPLFTVISNTFMDDYISFSGAENIASDLKSGTITRETIITRNPDVIFIVTMGVVGPEEKAIWEGYSNLTASKTGKIFIIESDKVCSPNPVTFVDAVEQLVTLIYK